MKLYNKTKIDDAILAEVLTAAGRSVGARTTGVVVKVTQGRSFWQSRGLAYRCAWVYQSFLATRARTKTSGRTELKRGAVDTDDGMFTLTVPYTADNPSDALTRAETIYSVAAHEWRHIEQYQAKAFDFHDRHERAKHHDNRAWERDSIKAASRATKHPSDKSQDAILALAVHLEALSKGAAK